MPRWVCLLAALAVAYFGYPQAVGAAAPAELALVEPVASCGSLTGTDLTPIGGPGSRVVKAAESTHNGNPVCSVEGTLAPSIGFRVDLPLRTWSQRYLQVGCGGLCGRISQEVGAADGCPLLNAGGFALASTDMGHQGMGGDFGADPQKRADFAYRAVHLTAVTAKSLIRRFYGRDPAYSYFTGCSDGGREALVEAQRFPEDFNGIIAGAAAMNFQVQNSLYHGWQALSNTGSNGQAILVASRLPILHAAVLKACDDLDGQTDGLITAPGLCHFDPASIECQVGQDTANCLTAAEVGVVSRLYNGPRDLKAGERLTVGGPQFGSELAWAGVYVPRAAGQPIFSGVIALDALRHLIFDTDLPAYFTLADLAFDRATFDRLRARHPFFDATNPDLSSFAGRGGKLILWHGWADPHISPLNTVAYHEAVRRQMGDSRAEGFERLYLLPGVYHCSGGEGPSLIDLLTPMMAWVESGQAPDAVLTTQAPPGRPNSFGQPGASSDRRDLPPVGATTLSVRPALDVGGVPSAAVLSGASAPHRTRPVYPYPHIAAYDGAGDPNSANSYRRGGPVAKVEVPVWAGVDFYQPYTAVDQ